MAKARAQCRRKLRRAADEVWAIASRFDAAWHPMVEAVSPRVENGAELREMVLRDGTRMRERLTFYSASDRVLAYEMVEGIFGATAYTAQLSVSPGEAWCEVLWSADIAGPEAARVEEIAAGTREVFQAGLDELERAEVPPSGSASWGETSEITCSQTGDAPRLSYLASGPHGRETLVLFLHGIGGAAENWRDQLLALGSEHRLSAWDMRGYGQSARGVEQSRIDDYCDDIRAVMAAEGASRLVLVGLSMGAWIATSFAIRHQGLMRGLVLAGGCTGMSEAPRDVRDGFFNSRAAPLASGRTPANFADEIVDVIAGPTAGPDLREVLRASTAAIPAASYLDALTCFCQPEGTFDFSRIVCPVLMMTGAQDRLAPPNEIRSVAWRIHGAQARADVRFEVIGGAGHVCNIEAPEAFNARLGSFLARTAAD